MVFFLIDDDEVFQFITQKTIKKISPNIDVRHFSDGEKGIDYIKAHAYEPNYLPDVVLLDINMPYMDGWDFLEEFKNIENEINKKITIYLLTSSDNSEDVEKARKISQISGYIVKPLTQGKLKQLLEDLPSSQWNSRNS